MEQLSTSPVGRLVRIRGSAGATTYDHVAYVPDPLTPGGPSLDGATVRLVEAASMALGRLDFATGRLPNPALLVRPALRREAQSTSAIEGTYAALDEMLQIPDEEVTQVSPAEREALNYVLAANHGFAAVGGTRGITTGLLCELQEILLRGTRDEESDTGRLRDRQVFTGPRAMGIQAARYVPPPHGDIVRDCMMAWEQWMRSAEPIPLLVKLALGHYQLEAIHPFSNGNGRIGRLVMALQLIDAGALSLPVLSVSPWLETRREEYVDHLYGVSRTGDPIPWIRFLSQAIHDQAIDMVERIDDLLRMQADHAQRIQAAKIRGVAREIAANFVGFPFVTPTQAAKNHGVTYPPANSALARLAELGIAREITGGRYARMYVCDEALRIVSRP